MKLEPVEPLKRSIDLKKIDEDGSVKKKINIDIEEIGEEPLKKLIRMRLLKKILAEE